MPELRQGDRGRAVFELTKALHSVGELDRVGREFNPDVESALKRFQQEAALEPTGVLDRETEGLLALAVEEEKVGAERAAEIREDRRRSKELARLRTNVRMAERKGDRVSAGRNRRRIEQMEG